MAAGQGGQEEEEEEEEENAPRQVLFSVPAGLGPAVAGWVQVDDTGDTTPMTYDDLPGPWVYDVEATNVAGKVVVTQLTIRQRDPQNPRSISTTGLRSVPLGTLVHRIRSAMRVPPHQRVEHLLAQQRTHLPKAGRSHPDEHYLQVAWFSALAELINRPPRELIAAHWQVSNSTASRWRRKARELGMLPDHDPRQALDRGRGAAPRSPTTYESATTQVSQRVFMQVLSEQVLPALSADAPPPDAWIGEVIGQLADAFTGVERPDAWLGEELLLAVLRHIAQAQHLQEHVRAAAATLARSRRFP